MRAKYYLQKVPVESVQPDFSLTIDQDGDYRLFQVECTQMSQWAGQPVMLTLMSEAVDGGDPWDLHCPRRGPSRTSWVSRRLPRSSSPRLPRRRWRDTCLPTLTRVSSG